MAEEAKFRRALVLAAHPDDPEFGCGGTIAKWAQDGVAVAFCLCTNGNKGTPAAEMSPLELTRTRYDEQRAAADVLGVGEVMFLDNNDAELTVSLDFRRQVTRVIRQFRPDAVFTHDPRPIIHGNRFLNHPDHRATGQTVLDAIYPTARDPLNFPEQFAEGLLPHKVRHIYLFGTDDANEWVDIADTLETKVEALKRHRTQMHEPEKLLDRLKEWAARMAEGHDLQYAEAFCHVEMMGF